MLRTLVLYKEYKCIYIHIYIYPVYTILKILRCVTFQKNEGLNSTAAETLSLARILFESPLWTCTARCLTRCNRSFACGVFATLDYNTNVFRIGRTPRVSAPTNSR